MNYKNKQDSEKKNKKSLAEAINFGGKFKKKKKKSMIEAIKKRIKS